MYGVHQAPSYGNIKKWCRVFQVTGSILKTQCGGRKCDADTEGRFQAHLTSVWGYIENCVYAQHPRDITELRDKTAAPF